jgi:hypothetical protein
MKSRIMTRTRVAPDARYLNLVTFLILIINVGVGAYYFFGSAVDGGLAAFLILFLANAGLYFVLARIVMTELNYGLIERAFVMTVLPICALLQLLWAFAYVYRLLGIADTAATNINAKPVKDAIDCFYFSVVTFTTVGYGDFRPLPPARLVAALEAVIGYFALAAAVAIFAQFFSRAFKVTR